MHVAQAKHLGKLLAQSDLHLVFGGIDAVFGQAAWLDVAIQDDDFMPALGNFLRGKHSRRSGTHYKNSFHELSFQLSRTALHKNQNLTTDNTDNTDLHGSKKFKQDHFQACKSVRIPVPPW